MRNCRAKSLWPCRRTELAPRGEALGWVAARAIARRRVGLRLGFCLTALAALGVLLPGRCRAAADLATIAVPTYRQAQQGAAGGAARLVLAATIIDGHESERAVALRRGAGDAEYGVSLETLGAALDIVVTARADGGFDVDTPLGHAAFGRDELTSDRGGNFVPLSAAAKKLGCRLRFDEAEYALVIDTPWRDLRGEPLTRNEALPIDVPAPRVSLSRWRSEVIAQSSGGDVSRTAITDLSGALGPGYWQGQILNGIGNRPTVNELVWVLDRGRSRWLLGQQRVAINPLLPGFDLTGVQMAYTNAPDYLYAQAPLSGQLVPYSASPLTVIRGEGPPGGIAELRLAGQVLMRQTIGLDGRYEFRNVPAAPGDTVRLEVAIYPFRDVDVPIRVDRVYSQAGNLQLPEGTWLSYLGAGANGRRLDPNDGSVGSGGFYQFRYGLSSALTVDAAIEDVAGHGYGSLGAAASLGPFGVWALYGAHNSRGAGAYELLGDGQRDDWFWHANVQHFDAGFVQSAMAIPGNVPVASDSSYLEAGRGFGTSARLSVVHGALTDPVNGDITYTRLAADWRPLPSLSLSVRPDYRGDYSYFASWTPLPKIHLSLTRYIDRTEGAAEYDVNDDYRLMATGLHQRDFGDRAGLFLAHSAFGRHHLSWTVGALGTNSSFGYFLEGALELRPGLTARLDVLDDPLLRRTGASGTTVTLDLVADFAVTGAGLARGGYNFALRPVGGISGALLGELPSSLDRDALAHVGISINGQVRTETDESGHFYVDELKPGVYRVSLDPDRLPIELSGSEVSRNVEVRAGATTRADFHLELRLGCGGRVLGYGDLGELAVAALDATGKLVARVELNRNGFFRIDGLRPGSYRLELRHARTGTVLALQTVEITDRFVFGRNFVAAQGTSAGTPSPQPR